MEVLNLQCVCGKDFQRENIYKDRKDALAKWKLRYCDNCLNARIGRAFNHIEKIVEMVTEINN